MPVSVEINTDNVIKSLRDKYKNIEQGLKKGIENGALYLEAKLVEKINSNIAPPLKPETVKYKLSHPGHGGSLALVATTQMIQQITSEVHGIEAKVGVIGSRAEVATHHEYGAPAAGIPERSFMRSTFNAEKNAVKGIIKDEIKKAL